MKKIASYILIMCLVGVSAYAGISAIQEADTFAENALKTGSFPLAFQHSTTSPWKASGGKVQSTNKDDNSEGWFSTTFELTFNATLSFEWYVSSEGADALVFNVDGQDVNSISGTAYNNFVEYTHMLVPGVHTLKWSYKKDGSSSQGMDEGQVKNIFITPDAFVVAGIGRPVCDNQVYYGNVTVGTPITKDIHLTNVGTEAIIISSITTEAPFSIGTYPATVNSLQKVTIPVTLTPTTEGNIEGKVIITTDYGTREIVLKAYSGTFSHIYNVVTPGSLNTLIPEEELLNITSLKLTGDINKTDFDFLKINAVTLKTLDLSELTFEKNTIAESFFSSITNIETIILPTSITQIGNYAFSESSSLKEIIIPDGVLSIGASAFQNCPALENITLPSALRTLGGNAFQGCSNLKKIELPELLSTIEGYTFSGCTSLETVKIGNGVTSVGGYYQSPVFEGCDNITTLVIGDGLTTLNNQFSGKTKLANVTLGKGFKELNGTFNGCTALETITLPEHLRVIGNSTFQECTNLTTINIPDSIRTIGSSAFYNCGKLDNIVLKDSLNSIGDNAFVNCASLKSIAIPDKVETLQQSTFNGCTSLETVKIGNGVTNIGGYYQYAVFEGCNNITTLVIGDGLTTLNNQFSGKTKLANVTLGKGFKELNGTFNGCTALETITLPEHLRVIGNSTFQECTNLTTINIPDSIRTIGSSAFKE